jgi:hypothetical protein
MKNDKPLQTLLVIVVSLVVLYEFTKNKYLLWVAIAVGVAGLLSATAAKAIHWFWMKLADVLGAVTGKLLLTIVFVVILIPLSLLSKWFGKPSIRLKPGATTYFKERNHTYTSKDLENPW